MHGHSVTIESVEIPCFQNAVCEIIVEYVSYSSAILACCVACASPPGASGHPEHDFLGVDLGKPNDWAIGETTDTLGRRIEPKEGKTQPRYLGLVAPGTTTY